MKPEYRDELVRWPRSDDPGLSWIAVPKYQAAASAIVLVRSPGQHGRPGYQLEHVLSEDQSYRTARTASGASM